MGLWGKKRKSRAFASAFIVFLSLFLIAFFSFLCKNTGEHQQHFCYLTLKKREVQDGGEKHLMCLSSSLKDINRKYFSYIL